MTTALKTKTTTWTIDKTHSNVDFRVKHLVVSTVRGHFREFDATLELDEENPENSRVTATIDVSSIDTNAEDRDNHLRSDDFFNAEQYPTIKFESTSVKFSGERDFKVTGKLTIRDVTQEVKLDGEFEGRILDPWGNERVAFSASTEISRKEFNVRWNQALEAGGMVVSDTVKINLYIEAVQRNQ